MDETIEPTLGVRIRVDDKGRILLSQTDQRADDMLLILHREQVPELIERLERARQESLDRPE